jgi:antitoxin component YwqK of YwqJK toxin-antitoxin module
MKRIPFFLLSLMLFTACQSNDSLDQVVSQTYVHKYGFETTPQEWEARERDGQVVTMLKNGVKISRTYQNGVLHGLTTYSFPHSSIVEKSLVYDQGGLLKETLNDAAGMPIREEAYEFDNRTIITLWDEKGVPLSIEEYQGDTLLEGKYYTPEHELEANVEGGKGERIKRDRTGLLISRDEIENGAIVCRTTYHPNGGIHTVSHYHDYQLHGPQQKYTASGRPLMELNWDHGVLDGSKIIYRNGYKVAVIPYVKGGKNGTELHYDDLGNLTAEIVWKNDKKHGPTKLYSEDAVDTEWFYKGQSVNAEKFKKLETRERIISEFNDEVAR